MYLVFLPKPGNLTGNRQAPFRQIILMRVSQNYLLCHEPPGPAGWLFPRFGPAVRITHLMGLLSIIHVLRE